MNVYYVGKVSVLNLTLTGTSQSTLTKSCYRVVEESYVFYHYAELLNSKMASDQQRRQFEYEGLNSDVNIGALIYILLHL